APGGQLGRVVVAVAGALQLFHAPAFDPFALRLEVEIKLCRRHRTLIFGHGVGPDLPLRGDPASPERPGDPERLRARQVALDADGQRAGLEQDHVAGEADALLADQLVRL